MTLTAAPVTTPSIESEFDRLINQLQLEDSQVWEREITPLQRVSAPLAYPISALPPILKDAVEEVHGVVQAPLPLVVSCALTSLSVATQGLYDVERDSSLKGPVSLYMISIGESGERKSTIDGHFSEPRKSFENAARERAKPLIDEFSADMQSWEAEKVGVKTAIQHASKKGDKNSIEALKERMSYLEASKPEKPKVPRLEYQDATQEALLNGMATNWPSAGIISDEGGAVTGGYALSKDSAMRSFATYNLMWGGQSLNAERMGRDSVQLDNPRLTIGLQIQSTVLSDFIDKVGDLARGTGLLARCCFSVPESTQGTRLYRPPPDSLFARDKFNKRITELLETEVVMEQGVLKPKLLKLSPDAKTLWVGFYNEVEKEQGAGKELHTISDIASKSAENVARLAALFHVLEGGTESTGISKESMQSAIRIIGWHLNEALRYFSEVAVSESQKDVIRLNNWLAQYCLRENRLDITRRNLQQNGPNRLRKIDRLSQTLNELEHAGRVRIVENGNQKTVCVNPAMLRK